MKKVVLAGLVAAMSVSASLSAQPGYSYGPGYHPGSAPRASYTPYGYRAPAARVAEQQDPARLLRDGMEKMLAFLRQSPPPDKLQIAGFLDKEIAPFFDFEYMARSAAGPLARDMSADQRKRLEGKLKEEFLGTLASRLSDYDKQQVAYLPARQARGGDRVTLSVAVRDAGPYPAKIDFRMRRSGDSWKVVDVAANGSSALAYYRDYFRRAVARGPAGPGPYAQYR